MRCVLGTKWEIESYLQKLPGSIGGLSDGDLQKRRHQALLVICWHHTLHLSRLLALQTTTTKGFKFPSLLASIATGFKFSFGNSTVVSNTKRSDLGKPWDFGNGFCSSEILFLYFFFFYLINRQLSFLFFSENCNYDFRQTRRVFFG